MAEAESEYRFRIEGMDCAEEVAILKRVLVPVVGGEDHLAFDILNKRMTVAPVPLNVSRDSIRQAVARTGMLAEDYREAGAEPQSAGFWRHRIRSHLTIASGCLMTLGWLVDVWMADKVPTGLGPEELGFAGERPLAVRVLYALGILAGVWYVLPKAWLAARNWRPDMNLLMTIAVLGAVFIGEWFEAATVSFLFSLSLTLESWSVGHARRAVAALMDLTPAKARLLRDDGSEADVTPNQIAVGDHFLVKAGERIPLDGRVVRGSSEVNQAPITGESALVGKAHGQDVFAGTINGDGVLTIQCTKVAADTTLSHIIRLVGEAQSRRAPTEQWVDRFARRYTPVVMGLALAVLLIPPVLLGGAWLDWFYRALVLLVIACPCALVISTPVSIVAALAAAARNGVLIKGGLHVEAPARLAAIAFDKTGTLTLGKPKVVEVVPLSDHSEMELLERAAALEAHSTHPLAGAILAYAQQRSVTIRPAEDYQVIQGKGATGRIDGQVYWLGSLRFLEEQRHQSTEVHQRLSTLSTAGRTVVVIGDADHAWGFIALADSVRPEAQAALSALRHAGIKHIVMLTGDNQATAQAIARQTGVDEVYAELMPADKVHAVESLVSRFDQVAMVGDGINDAPALARATLGIAMGAAGSDAAIETAGIALMSDDLSKLPWLVQHSRRTLMVIRQNILFSLTVKAFFVILTFAGYSSLWSAIAADTGASLLVVFNGLRLLNLGRSS